MQTLIKFCFQRPAEDLSKSCLFLARHHMKHERYDEATVYARKATDYVEVSCVFICGLPFKQLIF